MLALLLASCIADWLFACMNVTTRSKSFEIQSSTFRKADKWGGRSLSTTGEDLHQRDEVVVATKNKYGLTMRTRVAG